MKETPNGIYIGKDSTVAVVDYFRIAFLRLREDNIASILYHNTYGIVAVAYGFGTGQNATAKYCMRHPDTGVISCNADGCGSYLDDHARDTVSFDDESGKLIYTTHDGRTFENILAEKINMADFKCEYPRCDTVAECMQVWGQNVFFGYADDLVQAGIDTRKYSIYYNFSISEGRLYCRVGQNGYCERGRAMLSTVCIRGFECRMIANNLDSINDYRPDESCFAEGTCAFPADGGWYWSISEVTDDVIRLHGCGGDTYEIYRLHPWLSWLDEK